MKASFRVSGLAFTKFLIAFEDPQILPASMFEMKVHALRNSTHYMSMENPLTWDYVSMFISQAISSPSYSFTGDSKQPVKLIKTGSSAFKNRIPSSTTPNTQPTKNKKSQSGSGSSSRDKKESEKSGDKNSGDEGVKTPEVVPETMAERFAREKRRRDEMERQSREHLFEDGGESQGETESDEDAEEIGEEEEEMIEL